MSTSTLRMKKMLAALTALLSLSACVGAAPPTRLPATALPVTALPATPKVTPIAKSPDIPADANIVYSKTGGIAGVNQQWTIYPDGSVVGAKGEHKHVPADQSAKVFTDIVKSKLMDAPSSGPKFGPCPDCFVYKITLTMGGRTKTFNTYDSAAPQSAEIQRMFDSVAALVASAK